MKRPQKHVIFMDDFGSQKMVGKSAFCQGYSFILRGIFWGSIWGFLVARLTQSFSRNTKSPLLRGQVCGGSGGWGGGWTGGFGHDGSHTHTHSLPPRNHVFFSMKHVNQVFLWTTKCEWTAVAGCLWLGLLQLWTAPNRKMTPTYRHQLLGTNGLMAPMISQLVGC